MRLIYFCIYLLKRSKPNECLLHFIIIIYYQYSAQHLGEHNAHSLVL